MDRDELQGVAAEALEREGMSGRDLDSVDRVTRWVVAHALEQASGRQIDDTDIEAAPTVSALVDLVLPDGPADSPATPSDLDALRGILG